MWTGKSYQWWGSFITVWRPSKWYKGLAIRYMGEQSCNSCAVQRFLSAAPYAPPIVLQSFSCWVEKSPLGCCVHCYRSVNSILTGGFADVPFQNLAISARSNGSWLILSIELSMTALFFTKPLGSINDILVEEAPKRGLSTAALSRQASLP